ncbi:MAG TPA: hypothetical protein VD905_20920 [Flavobacteriales bacterium]|nr:hypothetical protein [Flavobacteriales bacterium]
MLYTIIALFAIAAIIGIYLISLVLQNKETPKAIAIVHGLFAATGLVLLIIYMINTGADLVQVIVLFAITALGGIVLFARDLMGKSLPKALALVHGLLAVTAFVFLLVYTFNKA